MWVPPVSESSKGPESSKELVLPPPLPLIKSSAGQRLVWCLSAADSEQPAGRILPLLLDGYLQQFRSHEQAVLADKGIEDLHALRVSLRRARALLSLGGSVFPAAQRTELMRQMGEFGRSSSQVRDLDILLEDVPKLLHDSGFYGNKPGEDSDAQLLQQTLAGTREAAFAELAQAIHPAARTVPNIHLVSSQPASEYAAMLRNWQILASVHRLGGDDPGADALLPATIAAQTAMLKQFSKMRSAGRTAQKSGESADWHRLRKCSKALRYALVGFGPLFAQDPKSELVLRLRKLQNVLGLSQDHAVQVDLIEQAGLSAGGRAALLAGALSVHLRQLAVHDQRLCSQAWSRFDHKGYKQELQMALLVRTRPSRGAEGTRSSNRLDVPR